MKEIVIKTNDEELFNFIKDLMKVIYDYLPTEEDIPEEEDNENPDDKEPDYDDNELEGCPLEDVMEGVTDDIDNIKNRLDTLEKEVTLHAGITKDHSSCLKQHTDFINNNDNDIVTLGLKTEELQQKVSTLSNKVDTLYNIMIKAFKDKFKSNK